MNSYIMFTLILLFVFSHLTNFLVIPQQIFEEGYPTCKYHITGDDNTKAPNKLMIANKVWQISGVGRKSVLNVILSPCGDSIPPEWGCNSDVAVCVKNTKKPKQSILNAGRFFGFVNKTVDDSEGIFLQSKNGQRCAGDENFTTIIEFVCEPFTKSTPIIAFIDECELRIKMMHPTCMPRCTYRRSNHLIDLRPLETFSNLKINRPEKDKYFVISFCKASSECGANINACEITDGNKKAIADTKWERITYDPNKNSLVVKSHYGDTKRIRLNMEIHIKCNWSIPGIANLGHIELPGRNYKFEGESSMACIKLPMDCVIKDPFENYIVYNLTNLNQGNWKVQNVSFGNMYLNICGSLRLESANNICGEQYAQVCYINGTGEYINLGSIPREFQVTPENTVKGTFVDGSVCATNRSISYSTEIEFFCGSVEKGPILNNINGCSYKLKWETPLTCSKNFATGDGCLLSDITGNINLNGINNYHDTIYNLTKTSYLRYNLCGTLNSTCNNKTQVGVCYINNGKEFVTGFSSKKLTRTDNLLYLDLVGDECNLKMTRLAHIEFYCNHEVPFHKITAVNMVQNRCGLQMKIESALACITPAISECHVYNESVMFDLTPLSRTVRNYIMQDSNSNVVYIINVCRSVTNVDDIACPPRSGACMHNLTEMNVKHRYISMGQVDDRSRPRIENGNLVIRYNTGFYCPQAVSLHRSTLITFQCHNSESGPRLLKKDSCSEEFIWKTPNACGKPVLSMRTRSVDKNCIYPYNGQMIDLSSVKKILQIETKNNTMYKFFLCDHNFTRCSSNGTECTILNSTVQLGNSQTGVYLEYAFGHPCQTETAANRLHVNLVCDPLQTAGLFKFVVIENCTFTVNLFTNATCSLKLKEATMPTRKKLQSTELQKRIDISSNNVTSLKQSCSVNNIGRNLNLSNVQPLNITSSTRANYTVTLNTSSSLCNGYICRNKDTALATADECPIIQFNYSYGVIKLLYNNYNFCKEGTYHSEIWLKCNTTGELPSVLNESKCNLIILYPVKDVCSLLPDNSITTSNTAAIAGSSLSLLVILIFLSWFFIIKKRPHSICSPLLSYDRIKGSKDNVRIYLKDSSL